MSYKINKYGEHVAEPVYTRRVNKMFVVVEIIV